MKNLTFYRLSMLTSVLFTLLAIIFMFAPAPILTNWGLDLTQSVTLLAKRIAALYVGIAVMFYLARNAAHSELRTALINGTITLCLLLATLGIYDFFVGNAASGILPSVFIELILALAFAHVACASSKGSLRHTT